jgi:hypothetical protein
MTGQQLFWVLFTAGVVAYLVYAVVCWSRESSERFDAGPEPVADWSMTPAPVVVPDGGARTPERSLPLCHRRRLSSCWTSITGRC